MRANLRPSALPPLVAALCAASWAGPAGAHPGHHEAPSLVDGLAHPLLGADHLMAMAAVGLIAIRCGSPLTWRLPLSFVVLTVLGGLAGLASPSAVIETGVALSVVCLGCWLVLGARIPQGAAIAVAGAFGFLHGWAHGAGLPAQPSSLWFMAGVLLSTGLLHLAGLGLGWRLNRLPLFASRLGWFAVGSAVTITGVAAMAAA